MKIQRCEYCSEIASYVMHRGNDSFYACADHVLKMQKDMTLTPRIVEIPEENVKAQRRYLADRSAE